ncbi:hypothetical protein Suden_0167 [Sulfurimonas denitrificans DSM 1251]|jgi:hypothetical protein|uniref:Uncharacterized protein n=1 Tax=Sulfurimonas denitrificans (strain ATCC 33889 / DSM 1251) TaxID=326298 RepID=Q30U83_SULDN|nr:hypothetical protein [Sulfurimonas denitrificans]ABB43448.1 hypothetical protein Suden_0167 [Sulfurimonas denitrificans DSM 1251]MDD3442920.1 hypothetical protein [Sulfurimonas denitrificans]
MSKFKTIFVTLFFLFFASHVGAQTPFTLSGVKSYYPVVELNTDKIDIKYKEKILEMLIKKSQKLGIETKNFSSRSLAFLIGFIGIGDTLALKMELMVGENAMRLDTKESVFVISYMNSRIFVPQELEEELIDNAEELLDMFEAQYKEDNL